MKLVDYQLQTRIESLSRDKPTQFFTEYLRSIIEDTTKPYYRRADYVGLSLYELKSKIETLSQDIRELEQLKKRLSESLDIAREVTATVFLENGIDKIDGNIISSLTISKPSSKSKTTLEVLNPDEVMRLGYVKFEPDLEALQVAIASQEGLLELDGLISVSTTTITTPAKAKVNAKRIAPTDTVDEPLDESDIEASTDTDASTNSSTEALAA